ncbi:I78 family peptidase inhibitor [Yoonia litorea]|uniref:Peptidase inhibitor I78 family protein n=1 Tax=Yoonia litorea TaxID=1123755 RepID=A0A1I6L200_9RHOB|nr:I78 family peptidase inhibitor [Yoonia litorea]SFR97494.1 Peptidase inhibitor I78 family protein [Yoonia litorea]
MKRILLVLVLGACAELAPQLPATPEVQDDTCNANTYADLVGRGATALERVLILGQVRVIRPDDAVTMDFRPERINFMIDDENAISRITCG